MAVSWSRLSALLSGGALATVLIACNAEDASRQGSAAPSAEACNEAVPTVTLPAQGGSLCGRRISNPQGQSADAYLGIPFAEAPTGERRWAPPVAKASLGGATFQATRFGEACIQPSRALKGYSGSEDCLTLNVYKPKDAGTNPLPVMVYIPGGGFLASQRRWKRM